MRLEPLSSSSSVIVVGGGSVCVVLSKTTVSIIRKQKKNIHLGPKRRMNRRLGPFTPLRGALWSLLGVMLMVVVPGLEPRLALSGATVVI
jgi:hypothetical protein